MGSDLDCQGILQGILTEGEGSVYDGPPSTN
jgi:hypothetical protein